MRRNSSGFTLIELMIVISIIGVLAAVLLPRVLESQATANSAADAMQMRTHFTWFTVYQSKHDGFLPKEGGHKFVLSTWTSRIFDHTQENLDKYFSPGSKDPHWQDCRDRMKKEEDPWTSIKDVTSADTHYVGRAKSEIRSATAGADEAWMANDNEGVWTLVDGTINVLFNGGNVRTYSYQDLQSTYSLANFDKNNPVATFGTDSPIPACKKLDN
jgi:prepilin-type N-terminal cleavage/methylation domain-containing protein